jgi:hypothetical protein
MKSVLCQSQLYYMLLVQILATNFGLGRPSSGHCQAIIKPSSGQNVYKNLNAQLYNVLFVSVIGSHLQSYTIYTIVNGIPVFKLIKYKIVVFDEVYILFNFNIILKHKGMFSTKKNNYIQSRNRS